MDGEAISFHKKGLFGWSGCCIIHVRARVSAGVLKTQYFSDRVLEREIDILLLVLMFKLIYILLLNYPILSYVYLVKIYEYI